MIYTPLTNKAIVIAYNAHHGQLDDNGIPYIFHPYHLAEQMDDEISTCVALLHDVVEDTSITIDDLRKEFPEEIIEAVALLTHKPDTDYFDYVRNLKHNPIAKKVKLADLAHNSDETRFTSTHEICQQQIDHWRSKYAKAKAILMEEE